MKARLLTVLLVSMLILAMAAPLALAQATAKDGQATAGGDQATAGDGQATAGEDRDNDNANITIVDCSQVQNAFVQGQYGNANASAQYDSDAVAVVAQELDISQAQVNSCLVNVGDDGDENGGNTDDGGGDTDDDRSDASGDASEENEDVAASTKKDVMAGTIPEVASLPNTGGPSLLALGAGLALVVGGASLIRFRR
ncbi:MAG: hypothetical protein AVDCRST_MAG03-632 [uncultured Rubrobacteraceae bacterium]|uniref:Gram-positive cocci surface proteins LPxTG domain-containing protein n=1 Tax=uncultured Rubrobacteraceae bacterium TaxID=349277 RepID=A0A6J4NTN0_9ACTN|nr:MAG: hypothetical protein AVDCRST_MAG03-632 [uncultured Rubrobacteraceae bacterium]